MSLLFHIAQAVAAAQPEAAAQQGVISYPPAFFAAFQPANAAEMVVRVPGFSLDTGASVRGFEGAAGNVLIDGERPSSKGDNIEAILRRLPASRVERIDLIRGGAPGIDMQGKTVLANIIRKPGGGFRGLAAIANNTTWDDRNATSARLEGSGEFGRTQWEIGLLGGRFVDDGNADGTGVRINRAGVITPVDIDSEADGLNGQATAVVETPVLGGKLRLNGRLFSEKFKEEEIDRILSAPVSIEDSLLYIRTDDTEIGGNFTRRFGAKTTLDLVALRTTRDQVTEQYFTNGFASDFLLDRESSEVIGRAVLKYRFNDELSVEAGGETAVNKLDSATRQSVDGVPRVLPAANVEVQEDRSEVFAKGVWRPSPQWSVDAQVRYEVSDIQSEGDVVLEKSLKYLKPRVAVTWAPVTTTQVRFRVEREVGQLNFNDFVASGSLNTGSGVTVGNPDLNPEQAWVAEVAVEQRFWEKGSATLTFRHSELRDAVDRGPVFQPILDAQGRPVLDAAGQPTFNIFDRPANIGDGTRDQLQLDYNVPLDRLGLKQATIRGFVVKRWSKVTDPTTMESREISRLRPIEWNATFTQDLPAWNITYGVDAFSAWRETSYRFNIVDITKLKTFVRPFAEWRPRPDINLRIELPNVTKRGLRRTTYVFPGPRSAGGIPTVDDRDYQPGRMFYFRLRKTFGG